MDGTGDPVVIALTAGQVAEFRALAQQEANAQLARNYAARAILLASMDHDAFEGRVLNIDVATATITVMPSPPSSTAGEA